MRGPQPPWNAAVKTVKFALRCARAGKPEPRSRLRANPGRSVPNSSTSTKTQKNHNPQNLASYSYSKNPLTTIPPLAPVKRGRGVGGEGAIHPGNLPLWPSKPAGLCSKDLGLESPSYEKSHTPTGSPPGGSRQNQARAQKTQQNHNPQNLASYSYSYSVRPGGRYSYSKNPR